MADMGRFADLPDQQLEQALADLGRMIDFPRSPNFASAIRSRLEAESTAERRFEPDNVRFFTPWRALAIAAAVAASLPGRGAGWLPDFRHAVADRLGVRGIKIIFEDETPRRFPLRSERRCCSATGLTRRGESGRSIRVQVPKSLALESRTRFTSRGR